MSDIKKGEVIRIKLGIFGHWAISTVKFYRVMISVKIFSKTADMKSVDQQCSMQFHDGNNFD